MLRWMSGKIKHDKIRNECIRERESWGSTYCRKDSGNLRCFGHIWDRPIETPVRRVDQMESSLITRDKGRHRKTIGKTIIRDLNINGLNKNIIYDRALWHHLIHVANPT